MGQIAQNRCYLLGGFFSNPMIEAGHDGLWYWERAREYAQKRMYWAAWFYYQTAAPLLDPADFLSSPNLEKLQHEAERIRPSNLPGASPMMLDVYGSAFAITSMNTTGTLGGLDLEVHYAPDAAQLAQLRDPTAARKQVIDVMTALLMAHPDLRAAYRGLWVRADQGEVSVFALNLPMNEIAAGMQPPTANSGTVAH